jgi:sugar phosphate isomerase/epimerase
MKASINRRQFTKSAVLAGACSTFLPQSVLASKTSMQNPAARNSLRISLNAYSFNKPLTDKTMTIDDMLDYCAGKGFSGVDLTGYYFPGYPEVPSDEYIYHVKKKAFTLGLGISGTGVRNDFTWADAGKRSGEKQLVRNWILVAEKLGAPIVRIFSGNQPLGGRNREEVAKTVAEDINECAEFGKKHGVMMALQNHNDFLKTSSDVKKMMGMVDRNWTGLLLDIGSYHTSDPYADVAATSEYAISWQLKEKVFIKETQTDTDYNKIIDIVIKSGYRGYLPLETLGEGDPKEKIAALLLKVQDVIDKKIV